jgi:hypothetical protein
MAFYNTALAGIPGSDSGLSRTIVLAGISTVLALLLAVRSG